MVDPLTLLFLSLEATKLCSQGVRKFKVHLSKEEDGPAEPGVSEIGHKPWHQPHSPSASYTRFAGILGEPFAQGRDDVHEKLGKIVLALRVLINHKDIKIEDSIQFQQLVRGFDAGLHLFAQQTNNIAYKYSSPHEIFPRKEFERFLHEAAKRGNLGYCSGALALQNQASSSSIVLNKTFGSEIGDCKRCGGTIAELKLRSRPHTIAQVQLNGELSTFGLLQLELARSHVVARLSQSSAAAFMCRQCHQYGHAACFATASSLVAHLTGDDLHPPINVKSAHPPATTSKLSSLETLSRPLSPSLNDSVESGPPVDVVVVADISQNKAHLEGARVGNDDATTVLGWDDLVAGNLLADNTAGELFSNAFGVAASVLEK